MQRLRHFRLPEWLAMLGVGLLAAQGLAADDLVSFNRDVRPILSANCFFCHGPDDQHREADLRLDTAEGIEAVFAGGKLDESEGWERITSDDEDLRMPPAESLRELKPEEIATLQRWIQQGGQFDQAWAYVPPVVIKPPAVQGTDHWIDQHIRGRLAAEGLQPSAEADRGTLIRRVTFDLTGLPPTPEEIDAFVQDSADGAFERVVDRLLASPAFGERMAAWWLDLVRYADTVGYHGDQTHRAWPYRDYVINAFNANLRFDQFIREQLAGDLLADPSRQQLVATCYNRLLQTTHEGGAQLKEYRAIYMADRVRNVSQVFMGATIGCAQCHNHKYDPYTARDFYALGAFFADVDDEQHLVNQYGGLNALPTRRHPELELPTDEQIAELARLRAARDVAKQKFDAAKGDARKAAKAEFDAANKKADQYHNGITRVMVTKALAKPRVVRILPRGNWLDETGEIVAPAIPEFLGKLDTGDRRANRLDLANWLVAPTEQGGVGPLTARMHANRLWKLLMGVGIARVLDDFGGQGEPPVHAQLLDRLALEFVQSGWDVKHLVRTIALSGTYRQASLASQELVQRDPDNRLYARQARPRLEAEMVRDNALAISGLLVREVGGPSVNPYQPVGYYSHLNFPVRKYKQHDDSRQWRRGVYVHWQRQFLHPMLKAFDAPTREECTASRPLSNIPTQALVLLNAPTFVEAARTFAARIVREGVESDTKRFDFAYRTAVGRSPTSQESDLLMKLLGTHRQYFAAHPDQAQATQTTGLTAPASDLDIVELAAWTSIARTVLNLSETNTRN